MIPRVEDVCPGRSDLVTEVAPLTGFPELMRILYDTYLLPGYLISASYRFLYAVYNTLCIIIYIEGACVFCIRYSYL